MVLAVNTIIGVAQELRAKRTLDRLAVLTAPTAHGRRDGHSVELPAGEVVLDDLLELRPGDQIVVDGLVIATDGLEIDESLVSGEAIRSRSCAKTRSGRGASSSRGPVSFGDPGRCRRLRPAVAG